MKTSPIQRPPGRRSASPGRKPWTPEARDLSRPRGRLGLWLLVILFVVLAAAPARASWDVRNDAPEGDFQAFHRRFSSAAYHYPRHGAAPLGLTGFEIYADVAVDQDFGDEPFVDTVLDDDPTGDLLAIGRVGVRKGLPGGIDLGVAYGQALESDLKLLSADIQYAILEGGPLTPALSVRVTGTRTLNSDTYELDQYGGELLLSKGFTVLTPYVGAGFVYSQGTLNRSLGGSIEDSETREIIYAGITLNLLLPKITVEVEKGEVIQGAVKIGIGF